jgi:DHA1 family bicyclomycin/chloramphenicol resistance-like MFS transporter
MFGGWLLLLGDWRWVFVGMGCYGILTLVLTCMLPETLPPDERTPLRARALLGSLVHVGASPTMLRIAGATAFGFAAQFLFIAAAPIFVSRLLGLGEQDFWMLFVPLIVGMIGGSYTVGRVAERMPRSRLITLGFLSTIVATVVNLLLVVLAPDPSGERTAQVLLYVAGPMLIAYTVSLIFAPIQLEIMDLFPDQRGAAASLGTFFSLVLNALLAGAIAPMVSGTLTVFALASLGLGVIGAALWVWHLRATALRG